MIHHRTMNRGWLTAVTLEMRWFFSQRPPWFDQSPEPQPWSERSVRTDWYAPISDGVSSVKLRGETPKPDREDREGTTTCQVIESKIQEEACHQTTAADRSLIPERWVKHSLRTLDLSAKEDKELMRLITRCWIGVRKDRLLCRTEDAIQIELASVELCGNEFWTYCIESPEELGADALVRWLRESSHPWIPPIEVLTDDPQDSWPSWLQRRILA